MFAFERQDKILSYLKENGEAEVSKLAKYLGVTEMTIRRDLATLQTNNAIYRTHGGAVYKEPQILWHFATLAERLKQNSDVKNRIGEYIATHLVEDKDSLFMDAGSTNLAVAAHLAKIREHLTVVTNSDIIGNTLLGGHGTHKVILAGGEMDSAIKAQTGPVTMTMLKNYHVDKAIVGVSGIVSGVGAFTSNPYECEIKALMIKNANATILATDSSKFGQYALICYCDFPRDITLVTDSGIEKEDEDNLKKNRVNVIIV